MSYSHRLLLPVTLLLLTFLSPVLRAGGIDQLQAFWAETRAAQGRFSQAVVSQSGRGAQQSAGDFAFARPNQFRWSYNTPYQLLLIADGEKLWTYDVDLRQVTTNEIDQSLGSSPAALLTGASLAKHFELTEGDAQDGMEIVLAKPLAEESQFKWVRIGLSERLPRMMEIMDNFGQLTTLRFEAIQSNPKLAADAFRFTPPEGVDIVGN